MTHLKPLDLTQLMDGALSGRALEKARAHLDRCAACRESLAALEAQDHALKPMLAHDPGEAYFESFPERVEARIRLQRTEGALAQAEGRPRLPGSFFAPRRLAWAGAVAAVVVGAGIVLLTARQSGMQKLGKPELMQRSNQVAQPPGPREAEPARGPILPATKTPAGAPPGGAAVNGPGGATISAPEGGFAQDATPGQTAAPKREAVAHDEQAAPLTEGKVGSSEAVGPSGVSRMRREPGGEEVPVPDERLSKFAQPPPTASVTPGEPQHPVKPRPRPLTPAPESSDRLLEIPEAKSVPRPGVAAGPGAPPIASHLEARDSESLGALQGNLCGTVRDRSSRPVFGAEVVVADLGLTTRTDREGRYCIVVPTGERTLSVMALGFETVRRAVSVEGGTTESDLTLEPVTVIMERRLLAGGKGERRPSGLLIDRSAGDFSTWPLEARELGRQAETKSERAARVRSAAMFDEAAEAWNRALQRVQGRSAEAEASARLAEARFRAWEIAPTPKRRLGAIEALKSCLVRVPVGSARDSVARRLDRVRQ